MSRTSCTLARVYVACAPLSIYVVKIIYVNSVTRFDHWRNIIDMSINLRSKKIILTVCDAALSLEQRLCEKVDRR